MNAAAQLDDLLLWKIVCSQHFPSMRRIALEGVSGQMRTAVQSAYDRRRLTLSIRSSPASADRDRCELRIGKKETLLVSQTATFNTIVEQLFRRYKRPLRRVDMWRMAEDGSERVEELCRLLLQRTTATVDSSSSGDARVLRTIGRRVRLFTDAALSFSGLFIAFLVGVDALRSVDVRLCFGDDENVSTAAVFPGLHLLMRRRIGRRRLTLTVAVVDDIGRTAQSYRSPCWQAASAISLALHLSYAADDRPYVVRLHLRFDYTATDCRAECVSSHRYSGGITLKKAAAISDRSRETFAVIWMVDTQVLVTTNNFAVLEKHFDIIRE